MTDIDAIRQREQAATPGPWTARTTYPHIVLQGDDEDAPSLISTTLAGDVVADAAFIAHARTDIPALLDLLATAEQDIRDRYEQIARLERHIAGLETQCNEQMHALTAERDAQAAVIAAVSAIHEPVFNAFGQQRCKCCGAFWPCATHKAISTAPTEVTS